MANELALRIRDLTLSKIDFVQDEAEGIIDGIVSSSLALDDAGDAFSALSAGDVDQDEIAAALVDLADIFDDAALTPGQSDKLNGVVDKLLKTGTPEQKAAAKTLFSETLAFGIAAKAANAYFDTLLTSALPPDQE